MPPKIPYDAPSAAETGRAVRDGRYAPQSERDRQDVENAKAARRGSAKTSSARMKSYKISSQDREEQAEGEAADVVSDRSARPAAKPKGKVPARPLSDDEGEDGEAGARYAAAEARYARTPRTVAKEKGKASDRRSVYDVTFGDW
jgi:hypothetical protein